MPPPETTTKEEDGTTTIGSDRIAASSSRSNTTTAVNHHNGTTSSSSAPVATRSLSTVQGDNNLLPAAMSADEEEEVNEKVELRGTPQTTTAVTTTDNDSAAAAAARSSILPYPRGADCAEVADWANSVMKECEELVIDVIDSRPSSLLVPSSTACVLQKEWAPHAQVAQHSSGGAGELSYADHDVVRHSMTLMATRTPLSGAAAATTENSDASRGDFRRIINAASPKLDKLVRLYFLLTISHCCCCWWYIDSDFLWHKRKKKQLSY